MKKTLTPIYFHLFALFVLGIILFESEERSVLLAFQSQQETNVSTKVIPPQANVSTGNANVASRKPSEPANAAGKTQTPAPDKSGAFSATAYCLRGRTASGGGVRRGIVAADRKILPLGTRIYVSAGKYSGHYLVTDTGGRIRGRILDIWVPNCSEAMRFGRRKVGVTVLGRG
jgi:3D (Asp-Asp-Asp) domain-containing protein